MTPYLRCLLATAMFLLACSTADDPAPTQAPTPAAEASATPAPITQEEFADRAAATLGIIGELEKSAGECDGFELEDVNFGLDSTYRAARQAFSDAQVRFDEFGRREGIQVPEDFDVRVDRLSDEDWQKMQPVAAEFLVAYEKMFGAMLSVANAELQQAGCYEDQ